MNSKILTGNLNSYATLNKPPNIQQNNNAQTHNTQEFNNTDNLSSISHQQTTHQTTSVSNQDTITDNISNIKEKINFAIHNIRGFNNLIKRQQWITYCLQNNLYIISITETKLKESSQLSLTNLIYNIFTSNHDSASDQQRESSLGTALMIHYTVQPYIHNIITFPGTALCLDFFFPNNKTRIISVYLPSNNPDLSNRTQIQVSLWSI